jgi:prevent-host-death family protein
MARTINATDANQSFSRMLREVQQGEEFVVLSRGRAVARVVPYIEGGEGRSVARLLDEFEKLPVRILPGWTRDDLYS